MSEETIPNPHDQLFREAFSRRDTAEGFFQSYLPEHIRTRLDWQTLQLQPGTYTDETLRGSESDLLYTVRIDRRDVLLYCLFEHQSTPDAWMPLRLLRYILGIWEQYRKQNPRCTKLPPVLPLVLYQGGAAWKADLSLDGLIDSADGLEPYQPNFEYLLVDLSHIDADVLQGTLIGKTALLALKACRQGFSVHTPRIFALLAEMTRQPDSLGMIRTLLRYICSVDNEADFADYIGQVEATREVRLQEEIMTIAEQLRKEGRQEGRQEGHQEGRQEGRQEGHQEGRQLEAAKTLLKILNKRFGSVPAAIDAKVRTASVEQLEPWIDAALDADDLTKIFSVL